ncbi:MFS transporter [Brevibacillus migulae]|uniref:MFS transporter n=1 Tax=Brevibacillus migulae TaxID=1644114 RepID=UPI00106EC7C4|nr:MFS transporter [Brevibacillus migulae]
MHKNNFRFLAVGQSLANLGDVLYIVPLISLLYGQTASVLITSLVPLVNVTARVISGLVAPLVLERVQHGWILRITQMAKTAVLLLGALSFEQLALWIVFVFVALISFLDGWAVPARQSLIPRIVADGELVRANGLLATADQTMQFVGWSSGGVMVTMIGSINVLWLSVSLYAAASAFMLLLGAHDGEQGENREKEKPVRSAGEVIKEGWVYLWQHHSLRVLTVMDVFEGFAGAIWMSAILLVYVKEGLGQGDEWWGYINASYMLGTIIGGIVVVALAGWMEKSLYRLMLLGIIGCCLLTLSFGLFAYPLVALSISFLLGPFYQVQFVAKQTAIQQLTEPEKLGKVFSAKDTMDTIVFGLSVLLIGALAEWCGVFAVYYAGAGLFAGSAVLLRYLKSRS